MMENKIVQKLLALCIFLMCVLLLPTEGHATYMPGVGDWAAIFLVIGGIIGLIISSVLTFIVFLVKKRSKPFRYYLLLWLIPFSVIVLTPQIVLGLTMLFFA